MTIIAYRDGVMAADSLGTCDDARLGEVQKLAKGPDGCIVGVTGELGWCTAFLRWVEAGRKAEDEVLAPNEDDYEALLVEPDGSIWVYNAKSAKFRVDADRYASGSGRAVARGAMELGASAEQAVKAAIAVMTSCGGPIQTLRLGE